MVQVHEERPPYDIDMLFDHTQLSGGPMKSKWIDHRGTQILFADYSGFGCDLAGLRSEVEYASDLTLREPLNSVLSLVDVGGTAGTPEIVDYIKAAAVTTRPHIRKMAVVGIQGYRKLFLRAVIAFSGQAIQPFDTREEAKQWLAS
jgi:hypothetical protein